MKTLLFVVLSTAHLLSAEPVLVTARLETNRVQVGSTTTLRVFAEIAPEFRDGTVGIFSWNVDALISGSSARFDPQSVMRPTSDKDPATSSSGALDGPNLRSIRDSFLNLMNAGRSAPVELFSVPVSGVSSGRVIIAIQAGSLADEPDFVVEPIGDGPTLTGGNYAAASLTLDVFEPVTKLVATISQTPLAENKGQLITVSFPSNAGYSYTIESTTNLLASWQALPNAPHNSGFADDTNSLPHKFYRVRITPE